MKKKLLAFSLPAGLLLEVFYMIVNRFFCHIPDTIAYPIMIASILLMLTGIAYHGYCLGKHRSPWHF
jgi:hypothetical protein